jgi:hypothetical protein
MASRSRPVEEKPMNAPLKFGPIAQIARSVRDIEQAEDWYKNTLGLMAQAKAKA